MDSDGAVRLVEELWSVPTFERRMAAALILELHADELRSEDLSLIEGLIRESRTHRASGVTMRETVKYLDAARAERLMRTYTTSLI